MIWARQGRRRPTWRSKLEFLIGENEPRNQGVGDEVSESETADFEGGERGDEGSGNGGIGEPEDGEIGKDEREELHRGFSHKGVAEAGGLQPELARLAHEEANEVDHDGADDGEEGGGAEGGNQEGHRGNHRGFEKDAQDSELQGKSGAMAVDFGKLEGDIGLGKTSARQERHLLSLDNTHAIVEQSGHQKVHREKGDEGEHEDAKELADKIVETWDRFAENGVEDAVFEVAGDEEGGGGEREDDGKELH